MTDTVRVASKIHTAIHIAEPAKLDEHGKPLANAAPLKSAILHGARHPSAVNEVGITEGVDAGLFRDWLSANEELKANGMVYELSDEDHAALRKGSVSYGWELGLKAVAKAAEADNAKGSTITHPGPVTDEEIAATSDTPNDDSPRSDVNPLNQTMRSALTSPTAGFAEPHAV